MRILLAEDENDLNSIISKSLSSEQYSVDSCFDGEEAIDSIDNKVLGLDLGANDYLTKPFALIDNDNALSLI